MTVGCEETLVRAIAGDPDEAEKLFRSYWPQLRQMIAGRIPHTIQALVEADDVLQETYAEAFLNIQACQAACGRTFFAWLSSIAEHNLLDLQRGLFASRRDVRRTFSTTDCERSLDQLARNLGSSAGSPVHSAGHHEMAANLRTALSELPAAYRSVIVLYDLRQLAIDKVAEQLQCSVGSVYMRRQRGHRMLRNILQSFSRHV